MMNKVSRRQFLKMLGAACLVLWLPKGKAKGKAKGDWHHFAMLYEDEQYSYFLDGAAVSEKEYNSHWMGYAPEPQSTVAAWVQEKPIQDWPSVADLPNKCDDWSMYPLIFETGPGDSVFGNGYEWTFPSKPQLDALPEYQCISTNDVHGFAWTPSNEWQIRIESSHPDGWIWETTCEIQPLAEGDEIVLCFSDEPDYVPVVEKQHREVFILPRWSWLDGPEEPIVLTIKEGMILPFEWTIEHYRVMVEWQND